MLVLVLVRYCVVVFVTRVFNALVTETPYIIPYCIYYMLYVIAARAHCPGLSPQAAWLNPPSHALSLVALALPGHCMLTLKAGLCSRGARAPWLLARAELGNDSTCVTQWFTDATQVIEIRIGMTRKLYMGTQMRLAPKQEDAHMPKMLKTCCWLDAAQLASWAHENYRTHLVRAPGVLKVIPGNSARGWSCLSVVFRLVAFSVGRVSGWSSWPSYASCHY